MMALILFTAVTAAPSLLYMPGYKLGDSFDSYCVYSLAPGAVQMQVAFKADLFVTDVKWPRQPDQFSVIADCSDKYLRSLYVVAEDGVILTEIRDANVRHAWSPEGKRIVYCIEDPLSGYPNGTMKILSIASGSLETIPHKGYDVYWSMKSSHILIQDADRNIVDYDPNTQAVTATALPSVCLSPSEEFCLAEGAGFCYDIYTIGESWKVSKVATIRSAGQNHRWLEDNSIVTVRYIKKSEIHFVYNVKQDMLYCSEQKILGCSKSKIALLDGANVVWKGPSDLESVPLSMLHIDRIQDASVSVVP